MPQTLQEFTQPTIGKKIWQVRQVLTYLIKDSNEPGTPDSHSLKNLPEKHQTEMDRRRKLLKDFAENTHIDVDSERMSEKDGKKLFSFIINEYREGRVSVDDLSALCEFMYGKFDPLSQTYSHLLNGAEVEWDIRNKPIGAGYSISELFQFFK